MSAKITVEMDDKTKAGWDALQKNIKASAGSLDQMAASGAKFGNVVKGFATFELAKKGLHELVNFANELADRGVPAFVSMREAVKDTKEAVLEIASTKGVQEWADYAAMATRKLNEEIREVPSNIKQAQFSTAERLTILGEAIGVLHKGSFAELVKIEQQELELAEITRKAMAEEKERARIEKNFAGVRKDRETERRLAALSEIKDSQKLASMYEDEFARFTEMANSKKSTEAQIEEGRRKLTELSIARLRAEDGERNRNLASAKRINDEMTAMVKKRLAEQAALEKETNDRSIRSAQAWVGVMKRAAEAKVAAEKDAAEKVARIREEQIQKERDTAEKLAQMLMGDKGGAGQKFMGGLDKRRVNERILMQRQKKNDALFAGTRADMQADLGKTLGGIAQARDAGLLSEEEATALTFKSQNNFARDMRRQTSFERKDARRERANVFRGRGVTEAELADARGFVGKRDVVRATGEGKIDGQTADLLKQILTVMQQNGKNEMELPKAFDKLAQAILKVTPNNASRTKSQRAGRF